MSDYDQEYEKLCDQKDKAFDEALEEIKELKLKVKELEDQKKEITDVDVYNWWVKNGRMYYSFQEFMVGTSVKAEY